MIEGIERLSVFEAQIVWHELLGEIWKAWHWQPRTNVISSNSASQNIPELSQKCFSAGCAICPFLRHVGIVIGGSCLSRNVYPRCSLEQEVLMVNDFPKATRPSIFSTSRATVKWWLGGLEIHLTKTGSMEIHGNTVSICINHVNQFHWNRDLVFFPFALVNVQVPPCRSLSWRLWCITWWRRRRLPSPTPGLLPAPLEQAALALLAQAAAVPRGAQHSRAGCSQVPPVEMAIEDREHRVPPMNACCWHIYMRTCHIGSMKWLAHKSREPLCSWPGFSVRTLTRNRTNKTAFGGKVRGKRFYVHSIIRVWERVM